MKLTAREVERASTVTALLSAALNIGLVVLSLSERKWSAAGLQTILVVATMGALWWQLMYREKYDVIMATLEAKKTMAELMLKRFEGAEEFSIDLDTLDFTTTRH